MASPRRAMMLSIVGPCSFYFFETSSLVLPIARKRQLPSTQLAWTTLLPRSGLAADKDCIPVQIPCGKRQCPRALRQSDPRANNHCTFNVTHGFVGYFVIDADGWLAYPLQVRIKANFVAHGPLSGRSQVEIFFRGENRSCMFIKVSNASTCFLSVLFRRLRGCPDLCVSGGASLAPPLWINLQD